MKDHYTRLLVALAVVLVAAVAMAADDPAVIFSISGEHKALERLGIKFTEPGNAAEAYLPYLNGTAPSCKQGWFQALNVNNAIDPKDEEQKQAQAKARAAAGPDLDALLAASRKTDYIMWGKLIKPDPKITPFSIQSLNFLDLARLAYLLVGDAKIRAAAGEKSAEERMLAAVRIGHHLEEDVQPFGAVWGMMIREKAAAALAEYHAPTNKEKSEQWAAYAAATSKKRKAMVMALKDLAGWPEDRLRAIILNQDIMTSFRLEALNAARYCTESREDALKCRITGEPAWVKKVRREAKFSDPQAAAILPLLDNPLSLDELGKISFIKGDN